MATSKALRGLDAQDGEHLLVANTPNEFADAVLKLLSNPELARQFSNSGRKYVEEYHNLHQTTQHLVNLYREAIANN